VRNGSITHKSDLPLKKRYEFAGWIRLSKTEFIIKHLRKKYTNLDFSNGSERAAVSFYKTLLHRINYQVLVAN
jgi:hypothetical protein